MNVLSARPGAPGTEPVTTADKLPAARGSLGPTTIRETKVNLFESDERVYKL